MSGFMFAVIPFIVCFSYYGTSFSTSAAPIPNWFFFTYCLCFFMYRILDEMDGKQARKTGNSTPLGMLFDHGCDAFTVGFILMTTAKFLNMTDMLTTMIIVSGSLTMFHLTTLEEYYVGGLFLGFMNPVTDLSIFVYGLYLYMGFEGNAWFAKVGFKAGDLWKDSPVLTHVDLVKYFCFSVMFVQFIMK